MHRAGLFFFFFLPGIWFWTFCSKDWKTVQPSSPMASGKEMCWVQQLPPSPANTLLWSPELLASLLTLSLPTPTPLRKSSAGLGQIPIFASLPHLQTENLGSPGCGGPSPKHLLLAQTETLPGVPPQSCPSWVEDKTPKSPCRISDRPPWAVLECRLGRRFPLSVWGTLQ